MQIEGAAGALVLAACAACGPQVMLHFESATDSEPSTTTTIEDPSTTDPDDTTAVLPLDLPSLPEGPPRVDLLLVIDNSGSMGEEQATMAASIGSLVDALTSLGVDWRIGVTTTDNGNPWCSGTTPEAGRLVASSCRSRLEEFTGFSLIPIDVTQIACLDVCPEEWSDIVLQPTTTELDPEPRARPWIESIGGVTNLPPGLSPTQALQCMAPQGIAGCGHEQHLESLHKAVRRFAMPTEDSAGFIREASVFAVVLLTDEVDCSYNVDHETIFLADGDRIFWSDPTAASPSSAVCWNAGVTCSGGGNQTCWATDYAVGGQPLPPDANPDDDAVLRPLSRYVQQLQEVEDAAKQYTANREVIVALIGGVQSDGSIVYQSIGADPVFVNEYGIGPGCEHMTGRAVPPVRLAEVVRSFPGGDGSDALYSICDESFAAAFEAIAKRIAAHL